MTDSELTLPTSPRFCQFLAILPDRRITPLSSYVLRKDRFPPPTLLWKRPACIVKCSEIAVITNNKCVIKDKNIIKTTSNIGNHMLTYRDVRTNL